MIHLNRKILVITLVILCMLDLSCAQQSTPYSAKEIKFFNPIDSVQLAATLTLPEGSGPFPAVVLIAGSGPHDRNLKVGKHRLFVTIADHLTHHGLAVVRYDKRGCGESGGKYEPHDIESFTNDALAAVAFLKTRKEIDPTRIGALGISQGGIVAPRMATCSTDVKFIVLLGAPGVWGKKFACASSIAIARASGYGEKDFIRIRELYDEMWPIYTKPELSESEVREAKRLLAKIAAFMNDESRLLFHLDNVDGYFSFMRSPQLLKSMNDDPADVLKQVKCPVLALFGSKDVQIPPNEHLIALKNALDEGGNHTYKIEELQDMNHVFQKCRTGLPIEYLNSKEPMAPEVLEMITNWILKITDPNGKM